MQTTWSPDTYIKAYRFAAQAHHGQTLAGVDLPYIIHVSLVSMEVIAALRSGQSYDGDLAVQCALLHDVIEDTATSYEQVQQEFGTPVADGVLALSKDKALPRAQQMPDSLRRIQQQPREVWLVKLADRITNLQPPPPHWTKARVRRYHDEARKIYTALKDAHAGLAVRLLERMETYQAFGE